MNRTPLHTHLGRAGAEFETQNDWYVAVLEPRGLEHGVSLMDASYRTRYRVEGPAAAKALKSAKMKPGQSKSAKLGQIACSRGDLFWVLGATGVPKAPKSGLVAIDEVTHGTSEIWVAGPEARALMRRVCGLDFQDKSFPDGAFKTSSVAKTVQQILRRDLDGVPCFVLVGEASLATYLWDILTEAGSDLNILPQSCPH